MKSINFIKDRLSSRRNFFVWGTEYFLTASFPTPSDSVLTFLKVSHQIDDI